MTALLDIVPDAWGLKIEVPSGAVTRTRTGPNEIHFDAPSHMALVMLTPQPDREVAPNRDPMSRFLAPTGSIEIIPATSELYARWVTSKENLLIALDDRHLKDLAAYEFDSDHFELRPPSVGFTDRAALEFATLIQQEFQNGADCNPIYIDSLITAFGTHLLRNYSSLHQTSKHRFRGGLAPAKCQLLQDYIRAHLGRKISIGQLAATVGLSPSHFLRAFRQTYGLPPHQYVMSLRLDAAAELAMRTEKPFAEIAAMTGFSSNSHLTATMKRHRGTTPRERRQEARMAVAGRLTRTCMPSPIGTIVSASSPNGS